MIHHLLRIAGIVMLVMLAIVYPFFPGKYDPFAAPLSTAMQILAVAGLLLTPLGLLWLLFEGWTQMGGRGNHNQVGRGYFFALAALIIGALLATVASLIILLGIGIWCGILTLLACFSLGRRQLPRLRQLRTNVNTSFNPTPIYLLLIPLATLLLQLTLSAPATTFSRNRAIQMSTPLLAAIETHQAQFGRYPTSLLALWHDYQPEMVGIEKYHYAPNGDAYDLFFEQPKLLLDNFGTREFVVYNKLDQHVIPSHTSWILLWSPAELASQQGWYAVHDTTTPHWKYFWFD